MKKAKIIQKTEKKEVEEEIESYSIKTLILIILIIAIVFIVFYFITTLVVKPSESNTNKTNGYTAIDSTKITFNSLLNRPEDEYYVLATKESLYNSLSSDANYINIYNSYLKDYSKKDNSLMVYRVNLDDALNKNYIADSSKISDDLSKLKLNDETLFKIKNGKIEEYYIGNTKIIEALSKL